MLREELARTRESMEAPVWVEMAGVRGVQFRVTDLREKEMAERVGDAVAEVDRIRQYVLTLYHDSPGAGTRLTSYLGDVLANLVQTTTLLMAAVDYQCTLADPPESIKGRPIGPNGNMMHKCFHDPAHCWDGTWQSTRCPGP
ncbi:MAG: hypothetical protein M3144_02760 [Actinomycetota bacterium]|nr:hypothetical protein [Actinomycetota bacterium]